MRGGVPTFVLEEGPATPHIARLEACQTCYMCELYCEHDAIYVAPDQFAPEAGLPDLERHLGRIRHDHGWDAADQSHVLDEYRKLGPLLGEGWRSPPRAMKRARMGRASRRARR
jgi:ferredoxin